MQEYQQLIRQLDLRPHPEGGYFREVVRSGPAVSAPQGQRDALTHIYFLLPGDAISRWHIVGAPELWHYYAGAPLDLFDLDPECGCARIRLAPFADDGRPFALIAAGHWQAARSSGEWTLVGCSVAPGFDFADFLLCGEDEQRRAWLCACHPDLTDLL